MPQPTLVNRFGKVIGWNSLEWNMFGRDIEGILEVEYNDNIDWENIYAAGKMPVGEGEGNYEASASVTLMMEEVRGMEEGLAPGVRLQDALGTALARYEYNGVFYTDRINNIRFKNKGVAVKQGDKTIGMKFDLKVSHIDWNI